MGPTYKSRATEDFWDKYDELPQRIQKEADDAYERFCINPRDPSLSFKPIAARPGLCSVRVNYHYRALGKFGDPISWFWIGTHAEYEKMIGE